jgi:hypothetical protein
MDLKEFVRGRANRKQDTKDDTFDPFENKDQSTPNHFNFRIAKYIKQLFPKFLFSSSSSSFYFFFSYFFITMQQPLNTLLFSSSFFFFKKKINKDSVTSNNIELQFFLKK